MKQTRKAKLTKRATRWADNASPYDTYAASFGAHGFERGYRAAMRDLRKLVRNARRRAMAAGITDAFKRAQFRDLEQRIAVDTFLRPLR